MAPAVLTVTNNVDDGVTAGSLRVILATANTNVQADTINFSGSMTINLSATGQLPISEASQGLLIDGGANSVVINGNATASTTNRLFTLTSTGSPSITFKNLTLASGNVSGANAGGAVLFTNQNLSFSSVTFSGNKTAGAGGAVATTTASPTISFDSCSFTNNSATGTGGAISLTGVGTNKLTLTNSTFTTNTSASTGGAIQGGSTTTFSAFTGNTFTGNTATGVGGAINLGALSAGATIGSSTFTSNKSSSTGGAINLATATTVTINNATFSQNTATNGGAINTAASTTTLNVNTTTFTNNSASSAGGAINTALAATVSLTSDTFTTNTSSSTGGAINAASSINLNTMDSVTMTGNRASSGGAMRFASGSTSVTLTNSTMSNNVATTGNGGAFEYAANGRLFVFNSTINNNVAANGGGAAAIGPVSLLVSNATISGNTASGANGGGAILITIGGGGVTLRNSTVAANVATSGKGGALSITGTAPGTTTIESTIIAGNSASVSNRDIFSTPTWTLNGSQNLFGQIDTAVITLADPVNNQYGTDTAPVDAGLFPLNNYKIGPNNTQTHGLHYTSLALTKGYYPASPTPTFSTDQRGVSTWPAPGPLPGSATDVGAVIGYDPFPFMASHSVISDVTIGGGTTYGFDVTYDDETGVAIGTLDADDVTITGPQSVGAVTFLGSDAPVGKQVTAHYSFTAPGGTWDILDNGTYTIKLAPGKVTDTDGPNGDYAETVGSFGVTIIGTVTVDSIADGMDGNYGAGQLTLREAALLAKSNAGGISTINFSNTIDNQVITLTGNHISLADPVMIFGNGAAATMVSGAVAAGATNRIFNINIPAAAVSQIVTIKNLTLTAGNATTAGGAITIADESVSLTSVNFTGNKSTAQGGAINTATSATLNVDSCTFTNNSATGNGGAIAMATAVGSPNALTITNSTFTTNTSSAGGGVIQGGSSIALTITGSTFTGNSAATGGGVGNIGVSTTSIGSSTFTNNKSSTIGGALSFPSASLSTITVTNSAFNTNTSTTTGGAINIGGASQTLNVSGSTFTGNSATTQGGVLNVSGTPNTVSLSSSTFTLNRATGFGGVIVLQVGVNNLTITNTTFNQNTSADSGGVMVGNSTTNLSVTGSTFIQNSAVNNGGVFYMGSGNVTIGTSTFSLNSVTSSTIGKGGVLNISQASTWTINDSVFSSNKSSFVGGAVFVGGAAGTRDITVTGSTFSGNSAASVGGAWNIDSTSGNFPSSVTFNESTLSGNSGSSGGAIDSSATMTLTVSNSTVSGNTATSGNGGGIRTATAGPTNIRNSTLAMNAAPAGLGGGIYFIGNAFAAQIDSTIIAANTALTNRDMSASIAITVNGTKNLFGAVDGTVISLSSPTNPTDNQYGDETNPLDPGLLPLANYGGPTFTHALKSNSKALDTGSNFYGLSLDQRGQARPDTITTNSDVGAVEGSLPIPFVSSNSALGDVTVSGATPYSVTVTYDDVETGIASTSIDGSDLTVTGPAAVGPVTVFSKAAGPGANQWTVVYQFTAPGSSWDILDNGTYTVTSAAGQILDLDGPANSTAAQTLGSFKTGIVGSLTVDNSGDVVDFNYGSGQLSLREAVQLTNAGIGGTSSIGFAPALAGATITLVSGEMAVTAPVTINGSSAAGLTISGAAAASTTNRIFNINLPVSAFSQNVALKSLALTKGNVSGTNSGGAVTVADESVTFTSMSFTSNTATSVGGAVISTAIGASLTFDSCTFTNNSSTSNGGAIATANGLGSGSTVTITNSTFTTNTAGSGSGGGAFFGGSAPTTTITNSTFTGNTAASSGGALHVINGSTTIGSSTFSTNKSSGQGGALNFGQTTGATNVIINSGTAFTGNTAVTQGGAIAAGASNFTLDATGVSFTNNSAGTLGGAILIGSNATVTLTSDTFTTNTSTTTGGAIHSASTSTFNLTATSTTFANNKGTTGGGAIRIVSSTSNVVVLDTCKITGNYSTATSGGGGVYQVNGSLTVLNSTISGNSAATGGGGISTGTASITLTNSTISGNTATTANAGGGIRVGTTGAGLTIRNSTITKNVALLGAGGGIFVTATPAVFQVDSTIIADNIATATPTNPDMNASTTVTLNGTKNLFGVVNTSNIITLADTVNNIFGDQTAAKDPGLFPLADYGGNKMPVHALKASSLALDSGSNPSPTIEFDQRGIARPVDPAMTDIGAVEGVAPLPFVASVGPLPTINAATAAANTPYTVTVVYESDAGINAGTLDTSDITVSGPVAVGSIVFAGSSTLGKQTTATYTFNPPGGAWDLTDGGNYTVNLVNGQVADNNTVNVLAQSLGSFKVGFLNNYLVDINSDVVNGIYTAGDLSLREALQLANANVGTNDTISFDASLAGQTILLVTNEIAISDPITIDAGAVAGITVSGAAIAAANNRIFNISIPLAEAQTATIKNLTLSSGILSGANNGGAVLVADESVTFSGMTFSGNKVGGIGGAVATALTGASMSFDSCSFTGNSATSNGGAIATAAGGVASNIVTITNSTFTNNTASGGGGAIQGGSTITLSITNSTFTSNTASTGGGALNVGAGNTTIGSSTFTANRVTTATTGVGGAANFPSPGTSVTVNSSVFTGNSAAGSGGAINGASTLSLTATSSTFTNNTASISSGTVGGGGIFTSGVSTVSLTQCTLTGNSATAGPGGAFGATSTITLSVDSCTINNNFSANNGGAGLRSNNGATTMTINASTLSGNTANTVGGAAVYIVFGGSLTITNSSLVNNLAGNGGGAIRTGAATVAITNSTISGNTSTGANGGGAVRIAGDGFLTIQNTTIAYNTATTGPGGGIIFTGTGGMIQLDSTILAANVAGTVNRDINMPAGYVFFGSKNLIGSFDTTTFNLADPFNNQYGDETTALDPGLFPLGAYGGNNMLVHGLKANSLALEMGSNPATIPFDQRGFDRVQPMAGVTDVGAVEGYENLPFVSNAGTYPNVNAGNAIALNPYTVTLTYQSDAANLDTTTLDGNDITVTGPFAVGAVAFAGFSQPDANHWVATYTFNAPGGSWDLFDTGKYTVIVAKNQVYDKQGSPAAIPAQTVGSFTVSGFPATTFLVDSIADTVDGNYGPGQLTLREAVALANLDHASADTIAFNTTTTFAGAQTITLGGTEMAITTPMTINGTGASKLTIDANKLSRIFNVSDLDSSGNMVVTISGMTITKGQTTGIGGAITQNGDTLNLNNCIITGNSTSSNGGAIGMTRQKVAETPILNGTNTIFSNNFGLNGGAIDGGNGGASITLVSCVLSGNSATGSGGGISAGYPIITLKSCTISGNTGQNGGGVAAYKPQILIEDTTISGNSAKASGAGIWFNNPTAGNNLTIRNTTITANTAFTAGGGIYRQGGTGITTLDSTIVAGNIGISNPDFFYNTATTINGDNNLIGVADVGNITMGGVNNQTGTKALPLDPVLGVLADNGGTMLLPDGTHTKTHALQPTSPAINTGSNPATISFDQRGFTRDVGLTDIGAYERAAVTVSNVQFGDGTVQRSMVTNMIVTFSEAVTISGPVADAFTLFRHGTGGVTGNVTLAAVQLGNSVTITFSGALAPTAGSLVDGYYDLTIDASKITTTVGQLDGDNDFQPGGNYAVVGDLTNKFFRLYGDGDGNGIVNQADFIAFRNAFNNGPSNIWDFEGDGNVTQSDFIQFRNRFNTTP